jgi:hypothetical protein
MIVGAQSDVSGFKFVLRIQGPYINRWAKTYNVCFIWYKNVFLLSFNSKTSFQ